MSIVPHGETCAAFCFLPLLLMAVSSLRLRHRHLIVALHGHQLMQPVAFLAVLVVALVFLGYERLNFRNDILALRKLLRCAQLVELTLGSVIDDKIRFMRGIELLPVLFFADRTILLDNGICFLRLPDVLGTRFTPAINSCGLSSDGLRRLLSRSDDPGWGVAALCCHRPPGTTRLSRSWRCSLTPTREVMARLPARLSQGACCLKKLFGCQGTPCRRGQTVTGSGTGRTFRLGSPSIYNGHFSGKKQGVYLQTFCEQAAARRSSLQPFLLLRYRSSGGITTYQR